MYNLTVREEIIYLEIENSNPHQRLLFCAELCQWPRRTINATLARVAKYFAAHPGESLATIYAGAFRRPIDGVIPPDVTYKGISPWTKFRGV